MIDVSSLSEVSATPMTTAMLQTEKYAAGSYVRIRRVNGTVWLTAKAQASVAVHSTVAAAMPLGFRLSGSEATSAAIPVYQLAAAFLGSFYLNAAGTVGFTTTGHAVPFYFAISWPTGNAWPTTLPGTAA